MKHMDVWGGGVMVAAKEEWSKKKREYVLNINGIATFISIYFLLYIQTELKTKEHKPEIDSSLCNTVEEDKKCYCCKDRKGYSISYDNLSWKNI